METQLNITEALALIAKTEFKAFDENDFACWAGVETEAPLIGCNGIYAIVIDGENINIIAEGDEYGGQFFFLGEN